MSDDMDNQHRESKSLDEVVCHYQLCASSFTSEHFIDFIRASISYYNNTAYLRQSDNEPRALLDAQAWQHTQALADAIQPATDFYRLQIQQHSEHANALMEFALIAAIGKKSGDPKLDQNGFLERLRRTVQTIVGYERSVQSKPDLRQQTFFGALTSSATELSPDAQLSYYGEIRICAEKFEQLVRASTTCLWTKNERQDPFYADLRNAFRSQFHETWDTNGLSSLDRLNLSVRVNLFLSHYSRVTLGARCVPSEHEGLPFYPYMALIKSSGSGKSRLLRELGRTLPLVYGNLDTNESRGYPLANKSLREFLLFEGRSTPIVSDIDSAKCEHCYEHLLLVTVLTFYLLFSDRNDDKRRITLPTVACLRDKVVDRGWRTAGICEPDGKEPSLNNDLFWEVVTRVTSQLLNRSDSYVSEAARTAESDILGALNELDLLEDSLRGLGKKVHSPKAIATGCSGIWTKLERPKTSARTNFDPKLSSAIPEPGDITKCILRYLDIRKSTTRSGESLAEIAKSLQRGAADMGSDTSALYTLFVAFDESRCLTKFMVRSNRTLVRSLSERDDTISVFRCLRRVTHHMFEKTGVSIFMLFSDTTAKLANFVPQRALDPPARMLPDKVQESPGQVHGPFTELGTESAGLMLTEANVFDFRKRLDAFCKVWQRPALDSTMECVSEQVTSLPFNVLKQRNESKNSVNRRFALSEDDVKVSHGENNQLKAELKRTEDMQIFRSNEDYVYLGRPLWASSMIHNQKGATWRDMVVFALEKLLGGKAQLAKDHYIYTKQCLAAIACRVPLRFAEYCGIAPQLVAEHMAWCQTESWGRESVHLKYNNEPLLATAAAALWDQELEGMLRCLVAGCGSYVSNKGDLGELAACIVLVQAVDNAYKNRADATGPDIFKQGVAAAGKPDLCSEVQEDSPAKKKNADKLSLLPKGLSMYAAVSLKDMLESSFSLSVSTDYTRGVPVAVGGSRNRDVASRAWIPKESDIYNEIFVPEVLAEADVRFKSIKRATGPVGCRDIPFLFEANVAVLTHRQQKGIDILIPLRVYPSTKTRRSETAWSCLAVQVKNRRKSPRASGTAGKHLSPILTQAVRCDATEKGLCERCMFIQESFFGIVLNVYSGVVSAAERDLGGLWTFLSSDKDQTDQTGDRHLFHDRKKRKLSDELDNRSKKEVADHIPQSACLIINGLANSSLKKHRSGLKPGIVRQIESLVAQGTLSGIVARKTEQYKDSVQKVIAAVAGKDDDEDYHMLKQSNESASSLAQDEEKSFARSTRTGVALCQGECPLFCGFCVS